MNKRIEELADQCNWQEVVVEDGEEWIHAHFDKQKFAELIVKECILTIQKGISLDGNTTEKFLRTMKHLKDIKEHFGIEE